jgi:hypothetical protein
LESRWRPFQAGTGCMLIGVGGNAAPFFENGEHAGALDETR